MKRNFEDSEYGKTGYWYYTWPEHKSVFKTDYPHLKASPGEIIEELTVLEYVRLALKYERAKSNRPKEIYYWYGPGDIVYSTDKIVTTSAVELTYAEYIELSIQLGQNPDDTLL